MKQLHVTLTILFAFMAITGCKKFSDLAADPSKATQGAPSTILTGIISKGFVFDPILGYEVRASQYLVSNNVQQSDQYYTWNSTDYWSYYDILRNAERMRIEAERTNAPVYSAFAKFFKAWCFIELTKQVGDIPMTDALKGTEGNYTPAYDTQKDVFKNSLALLDQANADIAAILKANPGVVITGDILYSGSVIKWQRLVNSYRLRVLIDLSKKSSDADLNVKGQFAAIFNNPAQYPVFTSNEEGAVFYWYDIDGNRYPRYSVPANMGYYRFSSTYMDYLTRYQDPRIWVVARTTKAASEAGKQPGDFSAYAGLNSGLKISDIYDRKDMASTLNVDRYSTATGEPMMIVGYPELNFNIAEAIHLGWIAGDANDFYQKGIRGSLKFYQSTGGNITDEQIKSYLAQDAVQYNGLLSQILIQKYLSFFNNSGWQSFYTILRTGVPQLAVGPGNGNNNQIPTRWMYPQSEYQYNAANINAAVQRQFSGADDRNGMLWLYK